MDERTERSAIAFEAVIPVLNHARELCSNGSFESLLDLFALELPGGGMAIHSIDSQPIVHVIADYVDEHILHTGFLVARDWLSYAMDPTKSLLTLSFSGKHTVGSPHLWLRTREVSMVDRAHFDKSQTMHQSALTGYRADRLSADERLYHQETLQRMEEARRLGPLVLAALEPFGFKIRAEEEI